MGFINFVIAILCWSCCRFVETTCMFLYLTVVQRTGSELEVVWFLMSDCISNQPALTTDRNRSVSGQKQIKLLLLRQSSTLWLVLLISVGDTFLKLFIQVDLSRSSWQPYTYKKKNCAPRKKIVRHAKSHCWDNLSAVNFLVQGRVQSGPHLCTMTIISLNC